MRKIIFVFGIYVLCSSVVFDALYAQTVTTTYLASSDIIANPERGWYDDYYSYGSAVPGNTNFIPLDSATIASKRVNSKITLILRLYYLHEYLENETVGEEYLEYMQDDFEVMRNTGVKCILRFAYSNSQSAEIWDATPEIVMSHISSLAPVLNANSDVIAGLQAGFVGAWGEWYYTENFASFSFTPDEEDQTNRRLLIEALLDALPANISVQGRTPAIMKNATQSDEPILLDNAFDGSDMSRIGHHNDCFLADASDYGTYTSLESDIAYLTESTKYTIAGGETCDASNSYSDCDASVPRMKELHWTYLNRGYNRQVYSKWEEQDCYDEVSLSLGYRINIVSTVLPSSVSAGEEMVFDLALENTGFAGPTQNKDVQIVLENIETNAVINIDYPEEGLDIRHWLPGSISLTGSITIPEEIVEGNYRIGISLKDQSPSLAADISYAIQFANFGIWDAEIGVNKFNHIMTIGDATDLAFPSAPTDIVATTQSMTQLDLTWVDASDDEVSFEIIRSTGNSVSWKELVTLDANETTFSDTDLAASTTYYYQIRSGNENGYSEWSTMASATTLEEPSVLTSSDELSSLEAFNLYPNPTKGGDLRIEFNSKGARTIIVHDLKGDKLAELKVNDASVQISRDTFRSGTYLVTVYDQEGLIQTRKVTLSR